MGGGADMIAIRGPSSRVVAHQSTEDFAALAQGVGIAGVILQDFVFNPSWLSLVHTVWRVIWLSGAETMWICCPAQMWMVR
jgi:hypothetical protein